MECSHGSIPLPPLFHLSVVMAAPLKLAIAFSMPSSSENIRPVAARLGPSGVVGTISRIRAFSQGFGLTAAGCALRVDDDVLIAAANHSLPAGFFCQHLEGQMSTIVPQAKRSDFRRHLSTAPLPLSESNVAMHTAAVVFPTPPLKLETAIIDILMAPLRTQAFQQARKNASICASACVPAQATA